MRDLAERLGKTILFLVAVGLFALVASELYDSRDLLWSGLRQSGPLQELSWYVLGLAGVMLLFVSYGALRLGGVGPKATTERTMYFSTVALVVTLLIWFVLRFDPSRTKMETTLIAGLLLALANVLILDGAMWRYIRQVVGFEGYYRRSVYRTVEFVQLPGVSAPIYLCLFLLIFGVVGDVTGSESWIVTLTLTGGVVIGESLLHVFLSSGPSRNIYDVEGGVNSITFRTFRDDNGEFIPRTESELRKETFPFADEDLDEALDQLEEERVLSRRRLPSGETLWFPR